ncbi:MAG: cytochrome c oxidase subunit II [bacterium]
MPVSRMLRRFRRVVVLLTVALLAIASFSVAAAQSGQPAGITDEAHKMHDLWIFTLIIATIVFVGVEGAILYCVFAFRKKGDALPAQTHGSTIIEVIWTTIPVVIVVALFSYAFIVLRDVENKAAPEDLTVKVQGFQFQWGFTYDLNDLGTNTKDRNATGEITILGTAAQIPTLVIPVGEKVEFALSSNDVIHSFYVRDFLYKLDVIPGRDNRFVVTARETGEFHAQCAELCGLDHSLMRFTLKVVTREEFDKWISEQKVTNAAAVQKAQ